MESDNGVFRPRAIQIGAGPGGLAIGQQIASLLGAVGVDSARVEARDLSTFTAPRAARAEPKS